MFDALVKVGWRKRWLSRHGADAPATRHLYRSVPTSTAAREMWRRTWERVDDATRDLDASPRSLRRAFLSVGMRPTRAAYFADVLAPLRTERTTAQLVDLAIAHVLDGVDRPMRGPRARYCHADAPEGRWSAAVGRVRHLNAASDADLSGALGELVLQQHDLVALAAPQRLQLWFHSTSWRRATSICASGPRHYLGERCMDFGISPSFYVTPDVAVAESWADHHYARWHRECAIVVFALPRSDDAFGIDMDARRLTHRRFETADAAWERLTRSSRVCEDDGNDLDEVDVVTGPMLKNVGRVLKRADAARAHVPPRVQLASKSARADRWLKDALVAVIWMEKI